MSVGDNNLCCVPFCVSRSADPQLFSLRALLKPISGKNYTKFGARLGSYCSQDPLDTNGLQTSCLGPYLFDITYAQSPITTLNMLNGTLPPAVQLSGLSHLQRFTCAGCGLVGQLPDDWGTSQNLLALRTLDLGTNMFTGTLPVSWGGLVNLESLTLSSSWDMAEIPRFWGNMKSLAFANFTNLKLDPTSCLPRQWLTENGLVPGTTLLTNADQPFCTT